MQHLLEAQRVEVDSIDDKVEMRFYHLEKSFDGSIELEAKNEPLDSIAPSGDGPWTKRPILCRWFASTCRRRLPDHANYRERRGIVCL